MLHDAPAGRDEVDGLGDDSPVGAGPAGPLPLDRHFEEHGIPDAKGADAPPTPGERGHRSADAPVGRETVLETFDEGESEQAGRSIPRESREGGKLERPERVPRCREAIADLEVLEEDARLVRVHRGRGRGGRRCRVLAHDNVGEGLRGAGLEHVPAPLDRAPVVSIHGHPLAGGTVPGPRRGLRLRHRVDRVPGEEGGVERPFPRSGGRLLTGRAAEEPLGEAHAEQAVGHTTPEHAARRVRRVRVDGREIGRETGEESDVALGDGAGRRDALGRHPRSAGGRGRGHLSRARAFSTSRPFWLRALASQITVRSSVRFSAIQTSKVIVSP